MPSSSGNWKPKVNGAALLDALWIAANGRANYSSPPTEIARQAAQIKLMRKLEKQALARAAKEARKQQGMSTPFAQENVAHQPCTQSQTGTSVLFFSNHGCWGEAEAEGADQDTEAAGKDMSMLNM